MKKKSTITAASLALSLSLSTPAVAQSQFELPITGDVLTGWVQADGSRIAALRLTLAPGWKTYWRAPGDAGIPPQFDWSGSDNLSTVAVTWPTPKVFEQNGMRSVGYDNVLIIPLTLKPSTQGEPVHLNAKMALGVCDDICIPHEMVFDAVLNSDTQKPTPAIAASMAHTPYSAKEAGVKSAKCSISPNEDGLEIETELQMPSAGGTEYVVIEPGIGDVWVGEAKTKRRGGKITATADMIHVSGGPIAIDRSAIRITVLGSSYAVDIKGCSPL